MNPLLLLGLLGVGGYVLFSSKTASASTSPLQSPSQAQQTAALLAANPSGLAPGFQGQVTPTTSPLPGGPTWSAPFGDSSDPSAYPSQQTTQPTDDEYQGGPTGPFDPSLGSVPVSTPTASGWGFPPYGGVGHHYNPFTKRRY
jgi:hypothetical protein